MKKAFSFVTILFIFFSLQSFCYADSFSDYSLVDESTEITTRIARVGQETINFNSIDSRTEVLSSGAKNNLSLVLTRNTNYKTQSKTSTNQSNALYKGFVGMLSVLMLWLITLPFRLLSAKNKKKDEEKKALNKTDSDGVINSNGPLYSNTDREKEILAKGGWRCNNCGKVQYSYVTRCTCGALKASVKENQNNIPATATEQKVLTSQVITETNKPEKTIQCRKCGAQMAANARFCQMCGEKVETSKPKQKFCRFCGSKIEGGAKFCNNCGKNLSMDERTETSQRALPLQARYMVTLKNGTPIWLPEEAYKKYESGELDLDSPMSPEEKAIFEERLNYHREQLKKKAEDYTITPLPTDDSFYLKNKDYIDTLINEGRLTRRIAIYVGRYALLYEKGFPISSDRFKYHFEVIKRELIEEYGVVGALTRFCFVLGVFSQLDAISTEELEEYTNDMKMLVIQDLKEKSGNNS